jgi:hypothetical protein
MRAYPVAICFKLAYERGEQQAQSEGLASSPPRTTRANACIASKRSICARGDRKIVWDRKKCLLVPPVYPDRTKP